MAEYIHHIPGRLRVRSPRIKQNPARALQARALLESLTGVRSVEHNPVTSSLVIRYDPTATDGSSLIRSLREGGYIASEHSTSQPVMRRPGGSSFPSTEIGAALVGTVVKYAVEAALERSVVALVAALL